MLVLAFTIPRSPDSAMPIPLPLADVLETVTNLVAAYHWIILAALFHFTVLGIVAYLILLERKTASWVQDRLGPNRVGFDFGLPFLPKFHFWGLGQPLADGLKFLVKEDYRRKGVDKILFSLAPATMIIVIIVSIAVIPFGGVRQVTKTITVDGERLPEVLWVQTADGDRLANGAVEALRFYLPYDAAFVTPVGRDHVRPTLASDGSIVSADFTVTYRYHFQIAHLNIGVLFVLAALSLAVYGVVIGGWASNNKYSFLGGLRATANMISYEIPLGMSVLVMIIMFGTLDLAEIVDRQATYWLGFIPAWNMFAQPLAFLLFLICIHAEANRAPFDMAEAEQELVGGYHTEYSSMRFAMFFLAEYAGMVTTSCVLVALFWGGWHMPWLEWIFNAWRVDDPNTNSVTTSLLICILRSGVFLAKAVLVLVIFMWVRWSLPRFRFDQLMQVAWKGLIPISLTLIVATTLLVYMLGGGDDPGTYNGLSMGEAVIFLGMNVAVLAIIVAGSFILPAGENQNVRVHVSDSRFHQTPLPSGVTRRFMASEQIVSREEAGGQTAPAGKSLATSAPSVGGW